MPYIPKNQRQDYDAAITNLLSTFDDADVLEAPGILNYIVSKIAHKLFDARPSYRMANTLIGILECIKLELYRRPISQYEDVKLEEHGDII